jgi:hypothetical protein
VPKMLSDGNVKLVWVPTIANVSSPKVATELTVAGALDISCLVTAANYALGNGEDATIDEPALCATNTSTLPGRTSYSASMNFFRWTVVAEDKAWTTFTQKNIPGYLVQRVGTSYLNPFAVGDQLQVYQVVTGTPNLQSPEANTSIKFSLNFHVQERVDERAVAVA